MALKLKANAAPTRQALLNAVNYHVEVTLAKNPQSAELEDYQLALALAIRQPILHAMNATEARVREANAKQIHYLSMEFLIGRLLANNLRNLKLYDVCAEAASDLGLDLADILETEVDPALGNGGLGRLAACFLDSLASLSYPGYGYGINYQYGLFRQSFANGFQREQPDNWAAHGTPWQIERREQSSMIPIYGRVDAAMDEHGHFNPHWMEWKSLIGVPSDVPVVGYGGHCVNFLRLYSARAPGEFDMAIFNGGDYLRAMEQQVQVETVSKVLYPSDSAAAGRELRFIQEYFFVACAMRDIFRRHHATGAPIEEFGNRNALQLNDTHPAMAVAELMRTLVDEHDLPWEQAWQITRQSTAYTNHTLLPEALEKWPVALFERVLPRHLDIVYEVNRRFLEEVAVRYPGDTERLRRMSIVQEWPHKEIRMAHLAIVGSHSVNGVAEMHSELVKSQLVPDFYDLWPDRFNNKTNGVTPRRWLLNCNHRLANLITEAIGPKWAADLELLAELAPMAKNSSFLHQFQKVKLQNKTDLVQKVREATGVTIDPASMFDVQIKRVHEYKRQLLNALHIMHLYLRLKEDNVALPTPKTFIFSGKAAPGYALAKLIIKLINNIARLVNGDRAINQQLRVVFYPDYKVSVAEAIVPAADLSEQISTAGYEASGTGNMKLAMNGALTIGTLDGANVEIAREVGRKNIYIFGHTADEVILARQTGDAARLVYESNADVRRVIDQLAAGRFSPEDPGLFAPIVQSLLDHGDYYMHLADFADYAAKHEQAAGDFNNHRAWAARALVNVARSAHFSSDRTIREYADQIWNLKQVI
ncbi:MAG TPA: glycogen/starch/alpha-glucan phosphorylase [Steroidobacteraceae bacterium]|nr:glycogen/starch/alpha-glucan phosphorylase [Steroidobacteraceae bacterium]